MFNEDWGDVGFLVSLFSYFCLFNSQLKHIPLSISNFQVMFHACRCHFRILWLQFVAWKWKRKLVCFICFSRTLDFVLYKMILSSILQFSWFYCVCVTFMLFNVFMFVMIAFIMMDIYQNLNRKHNGLIQYAKIKHYPWYFV